MRWIKREGLARLAAGVAFAAAAPPAAAHHVMGNRMPATFMEGLLSGLGHPVIGPDHLAFIVAIGIAAALVPAGFALIATFVAASTAGVLVHAAPLNIPLAEQLVALSVVAAGALIAVGRAGSQPMWLALAAIAGLFHGYAFGESIVGAERGVIGAYLIGIAIVAAVIACALMQFTRQVLKLSDPRAGQLRTAGVLVGAIGVVMLAGSLVSG